MSRPMNDNAWKATLDKRAEEIYNEFHGFSSGLNILFLIQRHRDGGETNNSHLKKIIVHNQREWYQAMAQLVKEKMEADVPLRVYSTCNSRDIEKGIREFKFSELQADYAPDDVRYKWYIDTKNKFISALMRPMSRAKDSCKFLWDCDTTEAWNELIQELGTRNIEIVKQYRTKQGWHVITKPFDYTKINIKDCECKKDGLLLLDF